jgi:plastocyanin
MMRLKNIILGVLLCGLLSTLVAACAIYDTSAQPTGPSVKMGAADFLQPSITIPKGSMLTLIDTSSSEHIIKNGSWVNGTAKPATEPGAPTVNVTFYGNDTNSIGPWNTPGTYHLYCTIHPGMNLTVIVK